MNTGNSSRIPGQGVVLANCCADWSAPCQIQCPIIDQIEKRHIHGLRVENIDVDAEQKLARSLRITSIPTLIFFREGKEIKRLVGLQQVDALMKALDTVFMEELMEKRR